jgi:F-type H+-transporting ATPase subunit delta
MDQNGAKRYSAALFEAARSCGRVEEFLKQMDELNAVLVQNPQFMQILRHPNLQLDEKKKMVNKAFKGRIDNEILSLIYILLDHDKIQEFFKVNLHYRDMVYKYKGIKIAYVTTAVKMNDDEIDDIRMRLSKKYACTIEVRNMVDPGVIGGVCLKVEDEITDGTVRGNFEKMRKTLMSHSTR